MNELRYFIVEDDPGVQKVLSRIIEGNGLGLVTGTAGAGREALQAIRQGRPDVVLLDFLLPELDGLAIMEQIRDEVGAVIMISEVADKEMVAKAYQAGIEFYIHKPVNLIEVMSVLRRVSDNLRLKSAVETLDRTFTRIRGGARLAPEVEDHRPRIRYILAQLGVQGDSGTREIEEAVLWTIAQQTAGPGTYRLTDLYSALCRLEGREPAPPAHAALEQRMRRIISKALTNIASLGLEDYGNEIFTHYAPILFEFAEVRRQMAALRSNTASGGKISIKKFIEGLATELQHGSL